MISTKNCKELAKAVVSSVKDVVNDCQHDDLEYSISMIDNFILSTKGYENAALSKARKSLTPLRNTLLGISDEFSEDGISLSSSAKTHSKRIKTHTNNFIRELNLVLEAASHKKPKKVIDKAGSFKEAEEKLRAALKEGDKSQDDSGLDERTSKDVSILLKYQNSVKKLPTEIEEGDFTVIKAPIIPVFNKVIFKLDGFLDKAGIQYDQIDFYFILKNQLLLAYNSSDDMNFVQDALDTMNNAGNSQYVIVADMPIRHPKAEVNFVWIMERTKFNKLSQLAGTFSVKRWSFPVGFRNKLK